MGVESLRLGAQPPVVHHFPDGRVHGGGRRLLRDPRPQRGPAVHLPHDGRRRPTGRAPRSRSRSSRSPSASSASCRRSRTSTSCAASPGRASRASSSTSRARRRPSGCPTSGTTCARSIGDIRHTLPQRRGRPVLQRRVRRHLRHHLRLHGRRLLAAPAARLRRGRALAAAAGAGRHQDRPARRAGRADLPRVLGPTGWPSLGLNQAAILAGLAGAERGAPGGRRAHRPRAIRAAGDRRLRVRAGPPRRRTSSPTAGCCGCATSRR